jgi:hypothetical protein
MQQGTLELSQKPCNLLSLVYETVQDHQAAYPSRLIELDLPGKLTERWTDFVPKGGNLH